MMRAGLAGEARVAERAARSGAGALLAAMLIWVLASGPSGQPASPRPGLRLDPNTATRAEWMLLPGIGPVGADAILAERAASGGAIDSEADLDRVRGIGPRRIEQLSPHLLFESSTRERP